ncbi:hypothetical protein HY640_03085 [Candidatus Woesearchaeota archaeon]|nr:hypothetical protein [Candidatus Woesearchaeota archaeon]
MMLALANLLFVAENTAIASTMHEPKGSLRDALYQRALPLIEAAGIEWYVSATEATEQSENQNARALVELLRSHAAYTTGEREYPKMAAPIEENHFSALELALRSTKKANILYIDSDRLTMALAYYAAETAITLAAGLITGTGKITLFTRSEEAMRTHNKALRLTEGVINHYYTKYMGNGKKTDPGSTAYMMPAETLEATITGYNGGAFLGIGCNFPQPKIILAAAQKTGLSIHLHEANNVLRNERPEQLRGEGMQELAKFSAGHRYTPEEYERLTEQAAPFQEGEYTSLAEWRMRFRTMGQYLGVLDFLCLKPRGVRDLQMEEAVRQADAALVVAATPSEFLVSAKRMHVEHVKQQ